MKRRTGLMAGAVLLVLALSGGAAAVEWRLEVQPRDERGIDRAGFVRRESMHPRVALVVRSATGATAHLKFAGDVELASGSSVVWRIDLAATVAPGTNEFRPRIPLQAFRAGAYRLRAAGHLGDDGERAAEAAVWIGPEPERDAFVMAMLEEQRRDGAALDTNLQHLVELGMTGVMHYQPTPALFDRCLSVGLNAMSISHGDARAGGFRGTPESIARLNASGQPFLRYGSTEARGRWGIASTEWQDAAARSLEAVVARHARHPGYDPRMCTSDDYFMWTGLDYNPANVARFHAAFGFDPPRPAEALTNDFPATVAREKGIIPDDDPWVLWLRFLSRDVLGRYNRGLAEAVRRATDGRGRIGPVCGGGPEVMGVTPLIETQSGQWPPYNFGANGFSFITYYNYNVYWLPALAQVWWAELGRMGNRELEEWAMPDTMDARASYHVNNWHLFAASGLKGLVYFIYERTTPGAEAALREVGPLARRCRRLLAELRPASRPVGLLVPFENGCFRASYPADASYAFGNLLMAHAEAEPVWPEELGTRMDRYRVIVLHDVDWLCARNATRLADFIARGGVVLCDAATEVRIPGARRLDFDLGVPSRRGGYGDVELIRRIRAELEPLAPAWARSDDPHLLLRRFRLEGVDFLWVVHLMTREEDAAHIPEGGLMRKVELRPEFSDFASRTHSATVSVQVASAAVYDVLAGRRIEGVQASGGRLEVPVRMGMWRGALLAFHPAGIDSLVARGPEWCEAGRGWEARVEIQSGGRAAIEPLPLELVVREPDGRVNREYAQAVMARGGRAALRIPFAVNDPPGRWTVTVRELSSGREQVLAVTLGERSSTP